MIAHDCYKHIDLASDPENPLCGWANCGTHFLKCGDCGEWTAADDLTDLNDDDRPTYTKALWVCGSCLEGRRDQHDGGIGAYEYWGIPGYQK